MLVHSPLINVNKYNWRICFKNEFMNVEMIIDQYKQMRDIVNIIKTLLLCVTKFKFSQV